MSLKIISVLYRRVLGVPLRHFRMSAKRSSRPLDWSPNARLNKAVLDKFMNLPSPDCKSIVEYVWIDKDCMHVRSKARTLSFHPAAYGEVPAWSYDGSKTGQAPASRADVFLRPVAIYKDPFRAAPHNMVLCESFDSSYKPMSCNNRGCCQEVSIRSAKEEPLFGLEQEFYVLDQNRHPFGWPPGGEPASVRAYCGVGARKVFARDIVEAHYSCCLYAGIELSGVNAGAAPSQWIFQVGPTDGLRAADDLWMARYILQRVAEAFGVSVTIRRKVLPRWSRSGLHANFSTKSMRSDNGMPSIEEAVAAMYSSHEEHSSAYGMPAAAKFSSGAGNRMASVRIPSMVVEEKKGYLEDRRPGAQADPYTVVTNILKSVVVEKRK